MSVHFSDFEVFGHVVTTPEMRAVFEERRFLQRWLDVEAALARAQGELGMIPAESAAAIAAHADATKLDLVAVREHGTYTGHPLLGTLKELRRLVGEPHAGYVHWGATTQDIVDTGLMLQYREAHGLVRGQLVELLRALLPLLERHRDTVMVGRTHGVHALPITFGFKLATWADELSRNLQRWDELRERVFVGSINGAVGTYAAWGAQGLAVQDATCRLLELGSPAISWQSARDRVVELTNLCALLAGTLERIAQEVYQSAKTEVGELDEPFRMGIVGSSTMPHKRNPFRSEWALNLTRIVRGNAAMLLQVMAPEAERDTTRWRTEWIKVPETFLALSAALARVQETVVGLQVHPERMERNLGLLGGVLLSEPVMFVLARSMPLHEAHEAVYLATQRAYDEGLPFRAALLADPHIAAACAAPEAAAALDAALEPRNYTGLAAEVTERVRKRIAAELSAAGLSG